LDLTVQRPQAADVGLLLLLLKDLWTGDLPLGGEASVGRGRLYGKCAELKWQGQTWRIEATNGEGRLNVEGKRQPLEDAVAALREWNLMEERATDE
ncbi:MAG: hypothetical protein ACRDIB_06960, partial [Ardenticatenaceae bacterium]